MPFICFLAGAILAAAPAPDLRVPTGFRVTEFAGSELANDIVCMAIDPQGRIIVSGKGYIRVLVEDTKTGRASRAIDLEHAPRDGAQGLLREGEFLYYVGDGGLRRLRLRADGLGVEGSSALIRAAKTGGEHESHAIRRGPDGWLYWLLGNNAGVDDRFAQRPTSPIQRPTAGCVVRFSPDLSASEIVADGFRNAYDMDFNPDGELFTFDSDNERCVSLPWYEGTRFYHVIPGGHHGWLNPQIAATWRLPPYLADVTAPVLDLGRGSPTAVTCYRGWQFPERYHGGFFLCDWTFGRVWFVTLKKSGASYEAKPEVFLECTGDEGFAPTAAAVHPRTGDLYIAIGGRGTRGAVYRVHHEHAAQSISSPRLDAARLAPTSLEIPASGIGGLVERTKSPDQAERLRALNLLYRFRRELEPGQILSAVQACWNDPDRYVQRGTAQLAGLLDAAKLESMVDRIRTPQERATLALAAIEKAPVLASSQAMMLVADPAISPGMRLAGVRVLQLLQGDLSQDDLGATAWAGYSPRGPGKLGAPAQDVLRKAFPSGDRILDRELGRTLAMARDGDPDLRTRVSAKWQKDSDLVEDIHFLLVFARLAGSRPREQTLKTAHALVCLEEKMARSHLNRERNWELRMAELYALLAEQDLELHRAVVSDAEFGRPGHELFARSGGFPVQEAARIFLARSRADSHFGWNPGLVECMGSLPGPEASAIVRKLWAQGGLEDAILGVLARQPEETDRDKYLEGLNSPRLSVVRVCLGALEKLSAPAPPAELARCILALGRIPQGKAEDPIRQRLGRLLERNTDQPGLGANRDAWSAWFTKKYRDQASLLSHKDGIDREGWQKRLSRLDWDNGNSAEGLKTFQKATCAGCHTGAQALGPDLRGVAKRFSRADLFTAIVDPNRDISSRYRTTQFITADDKVYQGIIIYEAVDGILLQTGPATTVRLVNPQIISRKTTDISLMPVGLLDKLTDRELADLYAYLKALQP